MFLPHSVKLILLAFVFLGLVYEQATPTFEASDEVWHYAVVREIADGRGLPVWQSGEHTTFRQEGGQPPAYYFVSAALTFWVDDSDFSQRFIYNPFARVGVPGTTSNVNMMAHSHAERFPWTGTTLAVRLVRWMSIVMGAVTVLLTYLVASALFPHNGPLALLAAAFTAFNPMFLFISASVNNDNGVWLLSSLVIWVVALVALKDTGSKSIARSGFLAALLSHSRIPWTLGILLSLATLTKLSGLVLAPVVYVLLGWRAWLRRSGLVWVSSTVIVTGILAIITGWWFWRNHMLYGDLLATQMMMAPGVVREGTASVADLVREAPGWWFSLWGVFGAYNILPADWTYAFYTVLALTAFVGVMAWALRARNVASLRFTTPQFFALIFVCLTLAGAVHWTRGMYASQGRLVLGAIAPISSFIAAGILGLVSRRWKAPVSKLCSAGLFVVALTIPVSYIAPRYSPPAPLEEKALPDHMISVSAMFNGEFELVGYSVDQDARLPGDTVAVTLYWRGLTIMDADYNLALNMHGRGYANIGKLDTWPGGGLLPTHDWEPGSIYPDRYEFPLPNEDAAPTLLRLDISFWDNDLDHRLPIMVGDGSEVSSLTLYVGRLLEPEPYSFDPNSRDGSSLEEGIILLGYDLPARGATGATVPVTLYWQTNQPVSVDYTVFVHLLDQSGVIVSQDDGPPAEGDWPTSAWQPGHPLADRHALELPEDLPAGEYSLAIGLYDPDSGARMAAFTSTGDVWRDYAIRPVSAVIVP